MRFVLAFYGTFGDVDPGVAIGRELVLRGHEVCMAVPPDLIGLATSAGLQSVPYGLEIEPQLDGHRIFWTSVFRNFYRFHELRRSWLDIWDPITRVWAAMSTTLLELGDGADLILTGLGYQEPAANTAEYYDIPVATLLWLPMTRVNGQIMPFLPAPVVRMAMWAAEWLNWLVSKRVDDAERHRLGLPRASSPTPRRLAKRGALEIQAYDEAWFPGLATEWAGWADQRPFVGALTNAFTTEVDDEIMQWIDAGTPPVYFGFGSIPISSPADTIEMISVACARLGVRALVGAGGTNYSDARRHANVNVVRAVNYAAILPVCRAVVHHGGSGTTAAGLRAGVPTLILWTGPEQLIAGAQLKKLGVGTYRRFSTTNTESLYADLRLIGTADYVARARKLATRMTPPSDGVVKAADLLEDFARSRRRE